MTAEKQKNLEEIEELKRQIEELQKDNEFLQEEFSSKGNARPRTDKLAKAFAQARADFGEIKKDKEAVIPTKSGGQFTYTYASLSAIYAAVTKPLAKCGLSLSDTIDQDDKGGSVLTVTLTHESGQYRDSSLPFTVSPDPKLLGSLLSYYERYLTVGILAIFPEDDLDGGPMSDAVRNQNKGRSNPPPNNRPPQNRPPQNQGNRQAPRSNPSRKPPPTAKPAPRPQTSPRPQTAQAPKNPPAPATPGEFAATFGKYKGIPVGQIEINELCQYILILEENRAKKEKELGKPVPFAPAVAKFLEAAHFIADGEAFTGEDEDTGNFGDGRPETLNGADPA